MRKTSAIDGSEIISVGTSADIRKLAGPDCKVIDLGGRRVLPGFNDSHVHFLEGGSSLVHVPVNELDKVRVYMTVFGGRVIYQRDR